MRSASTLLVVLMFGLPLCAQTPACYVQGRVVDEGHQPLPGVRLNLGVDAGKTVGTTGADGHFRIRLPDPGKDSIFSQISNFLDLEAEGRLTARIMVGLQSIYDFRRRVLGGQDLGTVVLPKGRPIQVRVRKERGRPLAGATVIADDPLPTSASLFVGFGSSDVVADYFSRAVTDEKGAAVIYGHADDGVAVVVEAEGYYRQHLPFHGAGMPLVVMMEPSGFISGKVVDHEGKPVQALLSVLSEVKPVSYGYALTLRGSAVRNFTNKDGTFRLNLDYPHRYRVTANLVRGTSCYQHPPKSSGVLSGPQQDVVIQLDKPKGVEGGVIVRVVDKESGEPVAGFRAAMLWQNFQNGNDAFLEAQFETYATTATEKGRILLPPPMHPSQRTGGVMIKADGYTTTLVKDVEWDDDKLVNVIVKLDKELPVHGVVVDEKTGKPVVGAVVWTARKQEQNAAFSFYPDFGQHPGEVLTDDEGRFRLRGLGKGKHSVHAQHPDHPDLKPMTVTLKTGEALAPLTLKLSHGFRYAGRIKGGKQRPGLRLRLVSKNAANPRVVFLGGMASGRSGERTAAIGQDGTFTLDGLEKGDHDAYLVVPRLFGSAMQMKLASKIEISEDRNNVELDVTKALPGRIQGKVVVNGVPAPAGRMVLVAQDVGGARGGINVFMFSGVGAWNGPMATIRRDGTFDMELAPSKYQLKVVDAGTGVVLWQNNEQVEVETGKASRQEFMMDLVLVRVSLVPKTDTGKIAAAQLGVRVDWPKPEQGGFSMGMEDSGNNMGGPGVPLADDQREIDLYLPPRETKLVVMSNARSLGPVQLQQDGKQPTLAEHEFTPVAGKTNRIEMKVSAPPEIEDPENKGSEPAKQAKR